MKTLVIYYSYTGHTKAMAEKKAKKLKADIFEVTELKKRSKFGAYTLGCMAAMKRKRAQITGIDADLSQYEHIIVAAPIWSGYPAPAFNNIVDHLPAGAQVDVYLSSASGDTLKSAKGTKEMITAQGCRLAKYVDVKTGA